MSKAAWFHCGAGTAGDMTLASLIDAGADSLQVIEILGGLALDDYALCSNALNVLASVQHEPSLACIIMTITITTAPGATSNSS